MSDSYKLPLSFYLRPDVVQISKELLGKFLITVFNNQLTAGMIVETEAYQGLTDRASHSFNGRYTARTRIMYQSGGVAYVYLIYGMHHLFNIVTNKRDIPDAVLVRALQPANGIEIMMRRRGLSSATSKLSNGPALLTRALGITSIHSGLSLLGQQIWLEDRGIVIAEKDILSGKRVGISYAGKDAQRLWRFRIKGNPWCSRAK